MGNTIFFWRCIGIAQYLDYRSIGYWRYLSICRKMPFGRPETHFSLIFDQLPGAQEMDYYRVFEMLPLTTRYEKMVTISCLISFQMWRRPPKCKQKERFEGTFDIAQRTQYYRDNIGPIMLAPESDIVLGGRRTKYCILPILSR